MEASHLLLTTRFFSLSGKQGGQFFLKLKTLGHPLDDDRVQPEAPTDTHQE
jgi:hypothetical protein